MKRPGKAICKDNNMNVMNVPGVIDSIETKYPPMKTKKTMANPIMNMTPGCNKPLT